MILFGVRTKQNIARADLVSLNLLCLNVVLNVATHFKNSLLLLLVTSYDSTTPVSLATTS